MNRKDKHAKTADRNPAQDRIDTAVGAIRRLLRVLPLGSLELVAGLVAEAIQEDRACRRPRSWLIRGGGQGDRK